MSARQESELRAAPSLTEATTGSQHVAPAMSTESSAQIDLPAYSEASSSILALDSTSFSQASSSRSMAPGSDSFFDIAPRNDSTSFQVGYLGLKGFQAWLKGDVLVKLDTQTKSKGRYTKCIVRLRAKERALGFYSRDSGADEAAASAAIDDEIELFSHTLVVWDAEKEPTTSSAGLTTVPSTIPFSFPLTEDLPHCVHLRDSSLTYTITAQLFSEDAGKLPHAVKTVPVHLVRYTRPGPLNEVELAELDGATLPNQEYTLEPHNWIEQAPTLVYAQINRSIFRRAEPIDIRVRIPPPDPTSVSEKGLKLRAVEADLIRIIHVKRSNAAGSQAEQSSSTHPDTHEALLAHSGKLCRFHSQRPVLLRLTLHPPFDRANMPHPHPDHDALASGPVFGRGGGGGCESISQETLMHKVSFEVRIKIGIQGGHGERRDIVLRRSVKILPGAAGALEDLDVDAGGADSNSAMSEKERLKRSEKARMLADDAENAGASSSHSPSNTEDLLNFGMDDEYDGYEDVGRSLHDLIDAANEGDVAGSSSEVTDHAERLEQLRQFLEVSDPSAHDEGPPPSLLESRNDLQVEVEVEGVGMAVPRFAHRHPADHPFPNTDDAIDDHESLSPPPPIDAAEHSQSGTGSASYPVLSLASEGSARLLSDDDDPPPPISPLLSRADPSRAAATGSGSRTLHMPGGLTDLDARSLGHADADDYSSPPPDTYPAYLDLSTSASLATTAMQHDDNDTHPSYEAAMSGSTPQLQGAAQIRAREPPPYADGSGHGDPVPSFDQAIRQQPAATCISTVPRSIGQAATMPRVGRMEQQGSSHEQAGGLSDYQPPAYGTSPHPPSYDA